MNIDNLTWEDLAWRYRRVRDAHGVGKEFSDEEIEAIAKKQMKEIEELRNHIGGDAHDSVYLPRLV